MDAGKQPLDIVQALSNGEESEAQSFKEEGTRDESIAAFSQVCRLPRLTSIAGGSSDSTSSPQACDVQGTESFGTSGQSTLAQESGYNNMMESVTMNSSFEQLYPSFSCSAGDSHGSVQGYNAVSSYLPKQSNLTIRIDTG